MASLAAHRTADRILAGIHHTVTADRSDLFADSVLSDLIADSWFMAQQDVTANSRVDVTLTVVGLSPAEKIANAVTAEADSRRIRTLVTV